MTTRRGFLALFGGAAGVAVGLAATRPSASTEPLPMKRCADVDMDLSQTSLFIGIGRWKQEHDTEPSVCWVHAKELGFADELVGRFAPRMTVLCAPWDNTGTWSVGTRRDYGFGSIGA